MNSGVIIVFSKNTTNLNLPKILDFIDKYKCKICLVNNSNDEKILQELRKIEFERKNIFLLNLRKPKKIKTVVKLATRLLNSSFEFSFIVFLESNDLKKLDKLDQKLIKITKDRGGYKSFSNRSKRDIFSHVFSINDVIGSLT